MPQTSASRHQCQGASARPWRDLQGAINAWSTWRMDLGQHTGDIQLHAGLVWLWSE
jgi:hypothetical protein